MTIAIVVRLDIQIKEEGHRDDSAWVLATMFNSPCTYNINFSDNLVSFNTIVHLFYTRYCKSKLRGKSSDSLISNYTNSALKKIEIRKVILESK